MAFPTTPAVDKITLVADTPTLVFTSTNRTSELRVLYVPVDPAADPAEVCVLAYDSDTLTAGDGFPIATSVDGFSNTPLNLVPGNEVWLQADAAGTVHLLIE